MIGETVYFTKLDKINVPLGLKQHGIEGDGNMVLGVRYSGILLYLG